MQEAGLPLLHALQRRPLRGHQGVGGDQEEEEVLAVGVVPQLEEQVGLLHWRLDAPCALVGPAAAFSAAPPPLGWDHSGQTRWKVPQVVGVAGAPLLEGESRKAW